jgi:UDP:flavonoid glycosyltransferase YjiC (YdhE family)
MHNAIQRILKEPGFRENAGRLADSFQRRGGAGEAARLIGGLVSPGKGTTTS